ncbi:MAG: polyprenyl synthetase family protein [Draconibacterium sp.]
MYSVNQLQEIVNAEIKKRSEELKGKNPEKLYFPIDYSLEMGGKRLRPVLLLLSYNLFQDDIYNALPAALAIEVFHNFTLLHDDIMDKADVRRNRETVHKVFGENAAILSGDAMAFLSYQYLNECKSEKLLEAMQLFTQTAIEVCEGQQFDMDFEDRLDVSESEYLEMIRLKTAVLLACSLKSGALLANASNEIAVQLYNFGINLGMAFQLQDDMLDTFGNQQTFGKRIGGDIIANKKTFLLIKAIEKSEGKLKEELLDWLGKAEFNEEEKINAVTHIYQRLNIKELIQQKVDSYFQKASEIYVQIPVEEKQKVSLLAVSNNILNRVK